MDTLQKAIPKLESNTILHSDQGGQYHSPAYHEFLKNHGITGSMSRKANPYDNAPMESFFSVLKNEELKLYRYLTPKQMRVITSYSIHYTKLYD